MVQSLAIYIFKRDNIETLRSNAIPDYSIAELEFTDLFTVCNTTTFHITCTFR